MQIVRGLLHMAARIHNVTHDIGTLCSRHSGEYIDTGIDCIGFSKIDGNNILMDVRELIVAVQQILMLRTIPDDGGREFLAPINRIFRSKGQTTVLDLIRS